EVSLLQSLRRLLSYLPSNNSEKPPVSAPREPRYSMSDDIIPLESQKPDDMKVLIEGLVDEDSFFEIQPDFAKNIVIGFARIRGEVVGVVANQPLHLAGCLD